MGLNINVYRAVSVSATNGPSAEFNRLTLINVSGPDEPCLAAPAATLEKTKHGVLRIIPVVESPQPWFMMGGNFGHTCDSRFMEACRQILGADFYGAVAIHDRTE